MFWKRRIDWNVLATPIVAIRCGGRPTMLSPSRLIEPESGLYTPVIALKTVVLPAPFGPMSETISPSST